jgi:hypothetical protein
MQVKATSPLGHNISGTAKVTLFIAINVRRMLSPAVLCTLLLTSLPQAAVQSLLAFYIWGNPATAKGILGIFLVLGGSALYTMVQMQGSPPPPQAQPQIPGTGPAQGVDTDKERESLLPSADDVNKKTGKT